MSDEHADSIQRCRTAAQLRRTLAKIEPGHTWAIVKGGGLWSLMERGYVWTTGDLDNVKNRLAGYYKHA